MGDREQSAAQGRNIFEALFSYVKRDSNGTHSIPESSPPCADTPPTVDSGQDECDSVAASALSNHTPEPDALELNSAVATLPDNRCPSKSCPKASNFRPNALDSAILPRPSSPCLPLRQLDVLPPVITSRSEPTSPISTIPTSPKPAFLSSAQSEQLNPENVPGGSSSPSRNTVTSSEYQSRIAAYLRPVWSYPGIPLSPPLTEPPPPSGEQEEGIGCSKSFLGEKDLTATLTSLMPPSTNFTQLDQAKNCCTGLRYPPALAAAMSLIPAREGAQVTMTYNSAASTVSGCRARDQGFLEIDASHFGATSLAGIVGSPPQSGDGHAAVTVEDLSEFACVPSPLTKSETSGRGVSRTAGFHCGAGVGRTGRPRRPASRYTPEPKRRPFKTASLRIGRPSGSRLIRRLAASASMETQTPMMDSVGDTLWIDSPNDCDVSRGHPVNGLISSPLHNHTDPGPSVVQTSASLPPSPSVTTGDPTNHYPSTSYSDLSWSTFMHRFKIGEPLLDEVVRRLSANNIPSRKALFAISSDVLTDIPCEFGRPHVIIYNMRHRKLLAGDAVRLIALALRAGDHDLINVANSYLDVCRQDVREAPLRSIRVRTPAGLDTLPQNWPELFSPRSSLRNLRQLPVVPCPPDIMSEVLGPREDGTYAVGDGGISWNLCCTPVELCDIIVQIAPFPPANPLNPPSTIQSEVSNSLWINRFLSLHPTAAADNLVEPALRHLSEFVPPRLLLLSRTLNIDNDLKALGGVGMICRLFRRLYTHLFLPFPSLGPQLLHKQFLTGTDVIRGTVFMHIKTIHGAVADCLAKLRDSYASLVSAGACLSALHRLRSARGQISQESSLLSRGLNTCLAHDDAVNPLDEGRSRLFDSAVHARQNVARILQSELSPCLMRLVFAVSAAYSHLVWVVMNDLFMFRSKRGIQLQTSHFAARANNACALLHTGLATLNFMDQACTENHTLWRSGYREVLGMCKAQFHVLKQPGLLDEMNKLLLQLKDFRCSLQRTRFNLKKQWCPAFQGNRLDEVVDCRADQDIKLLTAFLQYQFDLVEKWCRSVNNMELPHVSRNMTNIILRLADNAGRKALNRLSDAVPETLEIPYGSKNSQVCDWFGVPFELPALCGWPPSQLTANAVSSGSGQSISPLVINLDSPLKPILADASEDESTPPDGDIPSTSPFIAEMEENEDRRGNEVEGNVSTTKRHVSIETPLIPETTTEGLTLAIALPTDTLPSSSAADRRLLGRQNRMQKMREKEYGLIDSLAIVPPNPTPRKSTLTPAGRAARGKRMGSGSVETGSRAAKRLSLTNEPTGALNGIAPSSIHAANLVNDSAAQLDVLPASTRPREVDGLLVRPPPAAGETFPSTIDLTLED